MPKKTPKKTASLLARPPVIAILGHVDHGKTSLLDYIRKTHVQVKEVGGITQSIGAYQAEFKGKKLTFIDTPGHAAFSAMRSRGAVVADLAVLVVAGDDGVKPQTIESIKYLLETKTPFIVAINKIDKEGVVPDTAKAQLTEHQVFVEGYGGNTPVVLISAKSGKGVDSLLENLLLMAELEELTIGENDPLSAPIIEAKKDMKKGNLVSAVVKTGELSVGDSISTSSTHCKIRALFNDLGKSVKTAGPGEPIQILGFSDLPEVGETISLFDPSASPLPLTTPSLPEPTPLISPEPSVSEPNEEVVVVGPTPHLNVIIRADSLGALEAIKSSVATEINVILAMTGDIAESDVLLASTTDAIILGFSVKLTNSIMKLAETEGVVIKNYRVIYELLEYLEKKVLRLLEPTIDEEELGKGKIIKLFEINDDKIAGTLVESGRLEQGDLVHVQKKDGELKNARIKSLRVGKNVVTKVESGKECGVLFFPRLDLREKDIIISYKKNKTDEE
ncbi:MAG: translation initiation factor IF-2 [bacterium]